METIHIKAFFHRNGLITFLGLNFKRLLKKQYRAELKQNTEEVSAALKKPAVLIYIDMFFKCLVSCATLDEYFYYQYYSKSLRDAKHFFTFGRQIKVLPLLQTKEVVTLFFDKQQFNDVFKKYIRRDTLSITPQTPVEILERFINKHAVFIAKPALSSKGQGIWLVDSSKYSDNAHVLKALIEKQTFLLEEKVNNHRELNKFSASSLNTLRIITLRLPDGVKPIAAFIRFNLSGGITDNLSRGGRACPINIETGRTMKGMTDAAKQEYDDCHPDGFYLPGIKIPYWEEAVEMAKSATLFLENVYFALWDIAINDNGPLLIEANSMAEFNFQVMMDRPCNKDMQSAYRYAKSNKKRH